MHGSDAAMELVHLAENQPVDRQFQEVDFFYHGALASLPCAMCSALTPNALAEVLRSNNFATAPVASTDAASDIDQDLRAATKSDKQAEILQAVEDQDEAQCLRA